MKYSKDYFTGMKHLADAVKYELHEKLYYYERKIRNCEDIEAFRYFTNSAEGIDIAIEILDKVLTMQLKVKGGEIE